MAWNDQAAKPAPKSLFDVLAEWEKAAADLEEAKPREMALRKQVMSLAFANPKIGTNDYPLNNGYVLKAQHKVTRKFIIPNDLKSPHPDNEPTLSDAVDRMVEELRRCDNEGAFVAARLVKWEPKLVDKEYNSLTDKYKAIVDHYIETKNATPLVEIKAPKV